MPKITQFVVIVLCICALSSMIQISNNELDMYNEFGDIISEAYYKGEENEGGGALGAIIAIPMSKTIGSASYVVLVGTALLLTIFTFGIRPAEIIDKISERMQARKEEEEEEEEEYEEEYIPEPSKKKKSNKHSVIMEDLLNDEEDNPKKKKYDHDIPLAFEEHEVASKEVQKIEPKETPKPNNEEFIEANLFKEKKEEKEEKIKQELQLEHTQMEMDENYEFPPIALLEQGEAKKTRGKTAITDNAVKLQKTLHSFGVAAKVEDVSVGPAITRYELKPAEGVRVSKIANLADDIALNLAAQSIRIEAPIPGKQAVGIEIPNQDTEMVHLRDVIDSEEFVKAESKLSMGLGKDVSGARVIADIAKMPHLLVARKYWLSERVFVLIH